MSTSSSNSTTARTASSQLRPTGQMPVSAAAADQSNPAGRDVNITWWYTFLSIAGMSIFLLGISAAVSTSLIATLDGETWQSVVVLGLYISSAVPCVYASWLLRDNYGSGWPSLPVTAALLAVPMLSWLVTLFIPGATLYGAIPLWITLSTVLPLVKTRQRLPVIGVGLFLLVLHGVLNPGTQTFLEDGFVLGIILLIVLTPTSYLVSAWLWHLITRLDEARTISSQLAVARERLRFASDLHDIQGHHLQVIALKAELADRLLASHTSEHQHAAQLAIGEVRSLAEQAQSETRQLVRDLRVVSLRDELENAKGVLEAAGIATEVIVDSHAVDSSLVQSNRLLGFAVREATTNVLRHAHAQHVTISLSGGDRLHLEIHNDGVDVSRAHIEQAEGTGLAGLRHRFQQAGGNVNTSSHEDTFQLHATLPSALEENH